MTGAPTTRLAITLGDPRGIGPEITAALLRDADFLSTVTPVVVGPQGTVVNVQESVGTFDPAAGAAAAGALAGKAVVRAVELALAGDVEGIVTAPLDKSALQDGGFDYPGHTEMLGALTGTRPVMMLASDRLRVVLATTHIPLRSVFEQLTAEVIEFVAATTRRGLQDYFGIMQPRLALCAINPHAGEGGRFGREELDVLTPAAALAGIAGPFPADTVFVRAIRGEFDAVIAPYHDVGMTAIKVASFGKAVNVTLGLPFPRCSPDHGTAADIAGRGVADPSSMIEAARLCAKLSRRSAAARA